MSTFGIVGGGFLGMTIALRLAEDGHDVTLFEAAPELGGLASAWQLGEITWDRHYHVTLLSDSETRGVLRELGLDGEMEWVETRTGCYADGTLYSVSNSIEFLKFPPLQMLDKVRLGWTVFFASRVSNWKKLERETVESWLVKHSGRRTFDSFWLGRLGLARSLSRRRARRRRRSAALPRPSGTEARRGRTPCGRRSP